MNRILPYVLLAITCLSTGIAIAQVPPTQSQAEVRDASGRAEYIVKLKDDAAAAYSKKASGFDDFGQYHKPEVRNLVHGITSEIGAVPTQMTSYVFSSFTAFLDEKQADRLRSDPRVESVDLNHFATFSAVPPPWSDVTLSGDLYTWGRQAMIPSNSTNSNGAANVYVLDTGVGYYGRSSTLPELNVVQRVNGIRPTHTSDGATIGCYPHADHVAGIIGSYRNSNGNIGVQPGVKIISVSVLDPGSSDQNVQRPGLLGGGSAFCNCGLPDPNNLNACTSAFTDANLMSALDWVYSDILTTRRRVGIVNMSLNALSGGDNSWKVGWGGVADAMQRVSLATTGVPSYAGALVVESAGNGFNLACSYSYDSAGPGSSVPGNVFVVGGIDASGSAAIGYTNSCRAGDDHGSNYGSCVSMWAPSSNIFSTFPNTQTTGGSLKCPYPYVQSANIIYNTFDYLSGTSMAAPHVSGLAAYLVENTGYSTPQAIKQALNGKLYDWGKKDQAGLPIKMPTVQP